MTTEKRGGASTRAGRRPARDIRQGISGGHQDTPGVLLLNGKECMTSGGAVWPTPAPGPADEMLDRLWGIVGNNGLILITSAQPCWEYLVKDAGAWKMAGGSTWYTATRGRTALRLVLLDDVRPESDPLLGPDHLTTVSLHHRFGQLLGVPFYGDGGSTSAILMEETIKIQGKPPVRSWRDDQAPRVNEASWLGPWAPAEQLPGARVVRLDRNAHYLTAANSALLPADQLTHHPEPGFDLDTFVGLARIVVPANPWEGALPHPLGSGARPGSRRWVAHPSLEQLAKLGIAVEVLESWACPRDRARRLLVPWYEALRNARAVLVGAQDDESLALLRAVKDTYSRGIGCLDRPTRRWFRPDWRAILYAQARVSMYRVVHLAAVEENRWPAETRTDMVAYPGERPPAAFRLGAGLGQWKVAQ